MRPRGSFGEVAQAFIAAAVEAPGTVLEIAKRAQVGHDVGRYTASRLVACGVLVPIGETRPAVLAAKTTLPDVAHHSLADLGAIAAQWAKLS